jgi:hypothetical protein
MKKPIYTMGDIKESFLTTVVAAATTTKEKP